MRLSDKDRLWAAGAGDGERGEVGAINGELGAYAEEDATKGDAGLVMG